MYSIQNWKKSLPPIHRKNLPACLLFTRMVNNNGGKKVQIIFFPIDQQKKYPCRGQVEFTSLSAIIMSHPNYYRQH